MKQNIKVSKSNYLVRAAYRLTMQEQRLVLACLSKIDSRKGIVTVKLSAQDYATTFGIDLKNAHREMYDAADRLWDRSVIVSDPNQTEKVRWIQSQIKTNTGDGEIELMFSDRMSKYICDLAGTYTSYLLRNVSCLKSVYSIRLFELLMSWQKTGHLTIPLEDFREYLQLQDKYKAFKALNSRIITPCVKELNEKTGFRIELVTRKKGKTVTHLMFDFKEEEQLTMPF